MKVPTPPEQQRPSESAKNKPQVVPAEAAKYNQERAEVLEKTKQELDALRKQVAESQKPEKKAA